MEKTKKKLLPVLAVAIFALYLTIAFSAVIDAANQLDETWSGVSVKTSTTNVDESQFDSVSPASSFIKLTQEGDKDNPTSSTLTLKNTNANPTYISFNYSITSTGGSVKFGEDNKTGTDAYSMLLQNNESLVITLATDKGDDNSAHLELTNLAIVVQETRTIILEAPINGQYSVSTTTDGQTVSETMYPGDSEKTFSFVSTDGVQLNATADSPYRFYAWKSNDRVISNSAETFMKNIENGASIVAEFASADVTDIFTVGGMNYYCWEDAMQAAVNGTSKVVHLNSNAPSRQYTLPAAANPIKTGDYVTVSGSKITYTVPQGVAFLLPYADTATTVNDADAELAYANTDSPTAATPNADIKYLQPVGQNVIYKLIVPENTSIDVDGVLAIGGKRTAGNGHAFGGRTYKDHSEIEIKSSGLINVNSTGVLSTFGYITGTGTVNVSGGSVYEPFIVLDFHGGSYTSAVYGKKQCPFQNYIMMNIQSKMVFQAGSALNGYCTLFADSVYNDANSSIIGTDAGILRPAEGTVITTRYNASEKISYDNGKTFAGRVEIDINGNISSSPMALDLSITTVRTDDVIFSVPCGFRITQQAGTFTDGTKAMLWPGTEFIVNDGAGLELADNMTLLVSNGFYPQGNTSGYSHYPSSTILSTYGYAERGRLVVDGNLTTKSKTTFAGVVETTGSGKIILNGNTTLNYSFVDGLNGQYAGRTQVYNQSTQKITAKLVNGTVSTADNITTNETAFTLMEAGKTYEAVSNKTLTVNQFSFTKCGGTSATADNYVTPEVLQGCWFTVVRYDANGGTGAMNPTVVQKRTNVTIAENEFSREHYSFVEWNTKNDGSGQSYHPGNTVIISADMTLYAIWEPLPQFTVTWKDEDGTVLETDSNVEAGTTPTYDGATPTKASDAQYTYTFAGWTPEISPVTGDVTYTATYNQTVNTYTIIWKNYDGTVLETDENVEYGTMPTYNGETPTKAGDAQYKFVFTGWDVEPAAVTGNATYTATFRQDAQSYTITWKNADGTVLETDGSVAYGTTPTYDGATPTKTGENGYSYTFTGWSPAITTVKGDATYTATYTELLTITFMANNGTEQMHTQSFTTGELKALDHIEQMSGFSYSGYTFKGWFGSNGKFYKDGEAARFYEPVTLTAEWEEENPNTTHAVKTYTITWLDGHLIEYPDETKDTTIRADYVQAADRVTPPTARSYVGYSFKEWKIVDSAGNNVVSIPKYEDNNDYTTMMRSNIETWGNTHSDITGFEITAVYTADSDTCTVTAKAMHGDQEIGTIDGIPANLTIGDALRLNAPAEINGFTFSHWTYGDKDIPSQTIRIWVNSTKIDLVACYVGEGETAVEQQLVYVSDTYSEIVNGVNKIAAALSYTVPDGATATNVGFFYSRVESEVQGDSFTALSAKQKIAAAPGATYGTYTLHISSKSNTFKFYMRPFVIYTDSEGTHEVLGDYVFVDWDEAKVR